MDSSAPSQEYFPTEARTESISSSVTAKIAVVPYGTYEVVIILDQDNRFLGIQEIRITKDFLSLEQSLAHRDAFDVEDFYEDEDKA